MTHLDRGHYAKKHPFDRKIDQKIAGAVKEHTSNGEISCASAFSIVKEFDISPEEVGFTIDSLEITLAKCQLGLYGYGPHRKIITPANAVSPELEEAIRESLVNDRLPCIAAWEIASRLEVRKMQVSSACEALKVKIASCQLGAF